MNAALLIFLIHGFLWPRSYLGTSVAALAIAVLWPVVRMPRPANLVTAFRLLVALATFVLLQSSVLSPLAATGIWTFALALDGLDGWLARKTGPTAFGALLDMECDNVLLAVIWLAVASHASGAAPPSIASGLGLGLLIPLYRIGLVGLRALRPEVGQPQAKRLWGIPLGKLLFVGVAILTLIAVASLDSRVREALATDQLPLLATLGAVALSSYSFWPEYRAFLMAQRS